MADEAGFVILGDFYPITSGFKLGDPPLIRQVTGMEWDEFTAAADSAIGDPNVMLGMIAVSVSRKHRKWSRDRVAAFVLDLDVDSFESVGPEQEDEDSPPEQTEPGVSSPSSGETSSASPDSSAEASTPTEPSPPGSDTGSQGSLRAA